MALVVFYATSILFEAMGNFVLRAELREFRLGAPENRQSTVKHGRRAVVYKMRIYSRQGPTKCECVIKTVFY